MFAGPRLYLALGVGLVMALLLAWALRLDALRAGYKDALKALTDEAATVVLAVREASDNPEVTWETVPGQVVALGESNRRLKDGIARQNARIDDLAREAVRLKAETAELQRIADKARAQRKAALTRLSDMAATPGTRNDCAVLLQEAETALDVVREAGL